VDEEAFPDYKIPKKTTKRKKAGAMNFRTKDNGNSKTNGGVNIFVDHGQDIVLGYRKGESPEHVHRDQAGSPAQPRAETEAAL